MIYSTMKKCLLLLLFPFLLIALPGHVAAFVSMGLQADTTDGVSAWLRSHAVSLRTVDAGNGSADLQGLKPMIGDARVVALGECTHGTSEIFRMKHRLLEFLVTEMGFTIFSIEANLPETNAVNEYVLYGKGEPEIVLAGMYCWTWNTREVLEMIKWMRVYNIQHPDKMVQFTGFDMQFPQGAYERLDQFATQYAPDLKPVVDTIAAYCVRYRRQNINGQLLTREEKAPLQQALDTLGENFRRKGAAYRQLVGDSIWEWQLRYLEVLNQYVKKNSDRKGILSNRDQSMAENVIWLTEHFPGQKMVLWAHNAHIKKNEYSMGEYLNRHFRKELLVLGFGVASGKYTAVKRGVGLSHDNLLSTPVPTSFESYAQASGIGNFILDIRREQLKNDGASWLLHRMKLRYIGAVAPKGEKQFEQGLLPELYDGIIYLENTTSSVSIYYKK